MHDLLVFLSGAAVTVTFEAVAFIVWVMSAPKKGKDDRDET